MADTRKYFPDQPLDAEQILQEARFRWLRPTEILEILSNIQLFKVTPQPPLKPPAGSLFLYDRKALRYFRKDGHRWRKKKDGKTVREAHEKLKFGSVDVLHCYYAHGEDNENFQRRCYWMLDEKLEHVVLVHYREINEGYKSGVSKLLVDPGVHVENIQPSFAPSFMQTAPVTSTAQAPCSSSPNMINWNAETLSLDFEDINSKSALGPSTFTQSIDGLSDNSSLIASAVEGFPVLPRNFTGQCFVGVKSDYGTGSSLWPEICSSTTSLHGVHDQKFCVGKPRGTEFVTHRLTDAALNGDRSIPVTLVTANNFRSDSEKVMQEHDFNLIPSQFHDHSGSQTAAPSTTKVQLEGKDGSANATGSGELKKLDSFGRWMDKEIDGDFDNSLMASDSGNYWNSIGAENDGKEVSSLSHHMHLDIESLGPSLSQEQLFSIIDFSPDWAHSGVETKVLIVGSFLGYKKIYSDSRWGCMFGEVEVPAEVLTDNVIRCQAPSRSTGRVPFYLTCCNRLACSEVREFEYHGYPSGIISSSVRSNQVEELQFQMRLAKLLCLDLGLSRLNCSVDACEGCGLRRTLSSMRNDCKGDLESMPENSMVSVSNHINRRDKLIQSLLKDRLCEWLVYKVHDGGKGPNVLDERGQGVIHLAACLGYEWAMGPIVAASGNPNFRDAQGRTALHWASYFGREETVMALIRLDVDPTAVDDPTPASPGGHSAADLASSQGHKGIAGFLAEAFLNRHLSLLGYQPS